MGAVLLIAATRRRSAVSSEETVGALDEVVASTGGAAQRRDRSQQLAPVPERREAKPLRSSAVRLGRTVSSISFSRNAASYFPRPRLRSQTTMSMTCHNRGWEA